MDIFSLRKALVDDYRSFTGSFVQPRDVRIRAFLEERLANADQWPDPWLSLNPSFASGGTPAELAKAGLLDRGCERIFRHKEHPEDPGRDPIVFHRHQRDAIELARTGASYVLTTGTGSGKSLAYIVPIVDRILREREAGPRGVEAIVDEAHTCVADGAGGGGTYARTQRYDLMREIAKDPKRHLVLVTATPHSGKEQGFRNLLGLLDPELTAVDLDAVAGRARLARHFVQRRRADVRKYLAEETDFPSDRLSEEAPYTLSSEYLAVFERVLAYARGQVTHGDREGAASQVHQRVRWWSALALLRALASSPAAAAATLRTRASAAGAASVAEADELGRAAVLDTADTDSLEGIDATPGADTAADGTAADGDSPSLAGAASGERRRLLEVLTAVDEQGEQIAFHAMPMRRQYRRLLP